MSDFENRVRDALHGVAGEAPAGSGLAEAARRRARTRRRTVLAVSAAAVAAVIAVPAVLAFGGPDANGPVAPDPSPPVASTSTTPTQAAQPAQDGRVETWRNLEIRVPEDWGYGNLSTWCLAGLDPETPVVERPGGAVRSILCQTPASGYGAQLFDPAAYDPAYPPGHVRQISADDSGAMPFPVGAWVGYQYAGDAAADAAVLVVAPSEQIARDVLESVRLVEGADGNGCATRLSREVPSPTGVGLSVCRYGPDGWLEQSERLSAEDGDKAMAALAAAPMRQGDQEPCLATPDRSSSVVFGDGDLGSVRVVWVSECSAGRGVFFSGVVRELTEDVMYWALSPGWSGGVDGSVPLPEELRR